MDNSPFKRLSGELRNKIYELVLRHEPQEVVLNLTKWQLPKMERAEFPNKNVTQHGAPIMQTCRSMRGETIKLFYFTNTLVLDMADFEDHTSPIMTPPRKGMEKLQTWRNLVGIEAVKEVRQLSIMLHYHYLGPESKLELDSKAAAILKDVFHPKTSITFNITVHMPIPEMVDDHGRLRGLQVAWTLGESNTLWREKVMEGAKSFYNRFMELTAHTPATAVDDRIRAMVTAAVAFLASGILSIQVAYTEKPVFGPVLPPVMEAERETVARAKRQEAWDRQQDTNRRAVTGE